MIRKIGLTKISNDEKNINKKKDLIFLFSK
jgi:hypothetical protein